MATVIFPSVGLGEIMDAMISDVTHIAVGSGTTEPALGDTTLATEIERVAITNTLRSGAQATIESFFTTSQGNGTVREAGLFDAASVGNLWIRGLTGVDYVKNTTKQMRTTFTITAANPT